MSDNLKCEKCTEHDDENTQEYFIPHYDDSGEFDHNTVFILCDEHAAKVGFCPCCGYFVAGNEAHDRALGRYGYCAVCVEELDADYDDDHDYDDSWFD